MTFDSRCVCAEHGWPPDFIADRDRALEALEQLHHAVSFDTDEALWDAVHVAGDVLRMHGRWGK